MTALEQLTASCATATLTPEERARALQAIEQRRAALTAELAELDAIEAGHQAALDDPSE
ncbi:hypothetical protein GCM10008959_10630 [Deinococcus seoulensis]|uniref:Uncharacterized protein n=1 Tax=Deinococcus seoulensis TaxID=1837379 RepID=A0ABQ2RS64_9DEIO|nr:hypothetical protein [Deinococcus seoulensis]GGR51136.1 hypothetical protein GCM10008959_10630 [Deinococcus seoulensis]